MITHHSYTVSRTDEAILYCADGVASHFPHSHFQHIVAGLLLAGCAAKSFLIGWRNMCRHLMEGWGHTDTCVASCRQFQKHLQSVFVVDNLHSSLCKPITEQPLNQGTNRCNTQIKITVDEYVLNDQFGGQQALYIGHKREIIQHNHLKI